MDRKPPLAFKIYLENNQSTYAYAFSLDMLRKTNLYIHLQEKGVLKVECLGEADDRSYKIWVAAHSS